MLCTLDPGFMPEGTRAGGKGVLVQSPPPQRGLYIWQAIVWQAIAWQAIAWQATLDLGAVDSASRNSAPHPCARNWT
jgi:hypothetical protein